MYNLIKNHISKLTIQDVNNFAIKKDCYLSNQELAFTYNFIVNNWENFIKNPNSFNIDLYKNHYSQENFIKIKKIYQEYFDKFKDLL